jgi:hypothetical protein
LKGTEQMRTELKVNPALLLAVLPMTSSEESRPILHGVCFDPAGHIIATNGHILGAAFSAYEAGSIPAGRLGGSWGSIFHFPKGAAALLTKACGGRGRLKRDGEMAGEMDTVERYAFSLMLVNATDDDPFRYLVLTYRDVSISCPEVEGPFPNWRQVIPSQGDCQERPTAAGISVNPEYLSRFPNAGPNNGTHLNFSRANRAAVVRSQHYPSFVGVLMPVRSTLGEWAGLPESGLDVRAPQEMADEAAA